MTGGMLPATVTAISAGVLVAPSPSESAIDTSRTPRADALPVVANVTLSTTAWAIAGVALAFSVTTRSAPNEPPVTDPTVTPP